MGGNGGKRGEEKWGKGVGGESGEGGKRGGVEGEG